MLEVSISLVSRDRPELLDHALGLINEQDYPKEKIEVLLVDSSQPPLESFIRRRWHDRMLFSRIRYFHLQEPVTIGEKRNFAVEQARGSVILQWDDDDYYGPTRLREQVEPICQGRVACTALTFGVWYFLEDDEFWLGPPEGSGCGAGGHPGTLAFRRSLWSPRDPKRQYPCTNFADPDEFQSALVDLCQTSTELIPAARVDFVYVRHQHAAAAAAGGLKLGLEECFLGVYYEILSVRAFGRRIAQPTFVPWGTSRIWSRVRGPAPDWSKSLARYGEGGGKLDRLGRCTAAAIEVLHGHLEKLSDDDLNDWMARPSLDGSKRRELMKEIFLKDMIPALMMRLIQLPGQFPASTLQRAAGVCRKLSGHPGSGQEFRAMAEELEVHLELDSKSAFSNEETVYAGTEVTMQEMLREYLMKGKVEKIQIVNQGLARVYLRKDTAGPEVVTINLGRPEAFETKLETPGQLWRPNVQNELGVPQLEHIPIQYVYETNYIGEILPYVPSLLFLLPLLWVSRSLGSGLPGAGGPGGRNVFSMGKAFPSQKKDVKSKIRFTDVAGLDQAKAEVVEFVDFLKSPKKYEKLGARVPKGGLFVGPPGTGKTLLAKAVAGEADCPFYSMSGSDFVEMYVGVGASRVRDLFKQARDSAPSIIFIDEIDAIGRKRGKGGFTGGNDERESTLNLDCLNQMLVEMDGFTGSTGVVVLAGTNRVDILDNALLRPGRFDRQIAIDKPDMAEREKIYMVHLKPAAIFAARRKAESVTMDDFERATERVIGGLPKTNSLMTAEDKKTVAIHESGHAVAGWFLEHADPLLKVSIQPRSSGALGFAQYLPAEFSLYSKDPLRMLSQSAVSLGGRAAEELFVGKISTGASDDLDKVTKMAHAMVAVYGMSDKIGLLNFGQNDASNQFYKPYSEATGQMIDKETRDVVDQQYERVKKLLLQHQERPMLWREYFGDGFMCVMHKANERRWLLTSEKLLSLTERLNAKETLVYNELVEVLGERPYEMKKEISGFVTAGANPFAAEAEEKAAEGPPDSDGPAPGLQPEPAPHGREEIVAKTLLNVLESEEILSNCPLEEAAHGSLMPLLHALVADRLEDAVTINLAVYAFSLADWLGCSDSTMEGLASAAAQHSAEMPLMIQAVLKADEASKSLEWVLKRGLLLRDARGIEALATHAAKEMWRNLCGRAILQSLLNLASQDPDGLRLSPAAHAAIVLGIPPREVHSVLPSKLRFGPSAESLFLDLRKKGIGPEGAARLEFPSRLRELDLDLTRATVEEVDLQRDRPGPAPAVLAEEAQEGFNGGEMWLEACGSACEDSAPDGQDRSLDLASLFGPLAGAEIETVSLAPDVRLRVSTKLGKKRLDHGFKNAPGHRCEGATATGDVADDMAVLRKTFEMLTASFDMVCYTAGNHDLWVRRAGSAQDSLEKLRELCHLCNSLGVRVRPVKFCLPNARDVLLVPLLSFYASCWDQDPDLDWCPPEQKAMVGWMDFRLLKWPQLLIDEVVRREGDFKFGKDGTSTAISEIFAEMNQPLLEAIEAMKQNESGDSDTVVISFSHYLPRQELFPEKRFLVDSTLAKVSGSFALERQVRQLRPELHIFGHSHLTVDNVVEGQRYIQWALGYANEQKGMSRAVGDTGILVVFDSGGKPDVAASELWERLGCGCCASSCRSVTSGPKEPRHWSCLRLWSAWSWTSRIVSSVRLELPIFSCHGDWLSWTSACCAVAWGIVAPSREGIQNIEKFSGSAGPPPRGLDSRAARVSEAMQPPWLSGYAVALCWTLAAGAGGDATGNHTACQGDDHHAWWNPDQPWEFEHFEEVTVVALVGLTLLVDAIEHKLDHLAEHSPAYEEACKHGRKEVAAHDLEKKSMEPVWGVFLNRATAEFTVLGILAFVLWLCNSLGAFTAIELAFDHVQEFALPTTAEEYRHTTENVHMHLFMTFFLYYVIVGLSLVRSQHNMASWAASSSAFHDEKGKTKHVVEKMTLKAAHSDTPVEKGSGDFILMRQTFLEALQAWSGKWAFFDETLGHTIGKVVPVEDGGIVKYLEPWFPFGHYLLLNYRFLLDRVVVIHSVALVSMIVINGFQAIIHRFGLDFEFHFVWIIFFTIITAVLWFGADKMIKDLKSGSYSHGRLADPRFSFLHHSKLPVYLCLILQICMVYICFELTRPLAHDAAWQIDYWRSVSHVITCFTIMPLFGWLVWGNLLARLAMTLSCGFMISEENILRIQVMVEMHMESVGPPKKEVSHQDVQTDVSQAHTTLALDSL
eukprot:s1896_g5.t2